MPDALLNVWPRIFSIFRPSLQFFLPTHLFTTIQVAVPVQHAQIRATPYGSEGNVQGGGTGMHAQGRRLAMGGGSAESSRTSLRRGACPSTLAVPHSGKERRLATKDRAAAKDSSTDQRKANADAVAARVATGAARARLRASSLTNSTALGEHRPPTSMPRTTNRHRLPCASSG